MATSLENYYTLKIGQTITPSQWGMLLLTTNASRVAYNVDVPAWQLPNGIQSVTSGYVLDNQLDITFSGGIAQPYASASNWVAIDTAVDANVGAKMVVFHNSATNQIMVSVAGMDGFQNAQDQQSAIVYNGVAQTRAMAEAVKGIIATAVDTKGLVMAMSLLTVDPVLFPVRRAERRVA